MITIPTGDLTGILADVVPLACPDPELPQIHSVHIEWDGKMLHAIATDRIRVGISSWHPDDEPETDAQDDLFTTYGGADEPWSATIPLGDAKDLVKVFKLPLKEQRVPLNIELVDGRVKVVRHRDTGYSAITTVIDGVTEAEYPNVRALMSGSDAIDAVKEVAFTAKWLADFAKVRPRGPLELMFTGAEKLCHVAIGSRFVGAIAPVRRGGDA